MNKAKRSGGRPSREAAAEIESKIVDIARDLFFAHGYGATSIESIALGAGISKRTFYHRFENKAAIFKAVVNRLVERVRPGDVDGLFEGKSVAEILHRLARAMIAASLAPDTLALHRLMIAEATRFPELALVMSQQGARQEAMARIAKLLQGETAAKRLRAPDPDFAAEIFLSMVIALPQRRALGLGAAMSAAELDEWAGKVVELFLSGIGEKSSLQFFSTKGVNHF